MTDEVLSTHTNIEEDLRAQILDGRIEPGSRINVRQLESVYGVSHIPIREAIRRLEGEGLVTNVPRRGAIAAEVSLIELDEVYDLRRIVEPAVARRAIERATDKDRERVDKTHERLAKLEEGDTKQDYLPTHWDFHWSILSPGATGEIERLIHRMWRIADRYVVRTWPVVLDEANHQHRELRDHFVEGNADQLATVLERHLHLTGDVLRAGFNEKQNDEKSK